MGKDKPFPRPAACLGMGAGGACRTLAPKKKEPKSLKGLLTEHINPYAFPNIARIFHFLLVIPVTSANVERANSSLNFIKTDLRSTMSQSRLNALLLLFIHRSIPLDPQAVVDRFARAQPRRMLFVNPLSDPSADATSSVST